MSCHLRGGGGGAVGLRPVLAGELAAMLPMARELLCGPIGGWKEVTRAQSLPPSGTNPRRRTTNGVFARVPDESSRVRRRSL
jgi:hypothetical protein